MNARPAVHRLKTLVQQGEAGRTVLLRRLRDMTPYLIALLMPGGSIVALCMYVYQRRRVDVRA